MNQRELCGLVCLRGGTSESVAVVFDCIRGTVESGYEVSIDGFGTFRRGSGGAVEFQARTAAPRIAEGGRGKHPCKTCRIVAPEDRHPSENPTCAGCKLPGEYSRAIDSDGVMPGPGGYCQYGGQAATHAAREYRISKERLGCSA